VLEKYSSKALAKAIIKNNNFSLILKLADILAKLFQDAKLFLKCF